MKKVLLYSGGLDSFIISKLLKPEVKLYFDYGTKQNNLEKKYLPKDVIIKKIPIGEYTEDDGLNTIPLRNLIFSALAVNYGDEIIIGGLASDFHFDKTPDFAAKCTLLFNSVLNKEKSHRNIKITVPFAKYTKTDLVEMFLANGGTINELNSNSWSCHKPIKNKPCGKCVACVAREKAINEAIKRIKKI